MTRNRQWPFRRLWRGRVQSDIDAELRFHLDARIEELIGHGLSADNAQRQALAEFGDVESVRTNLRAIDDRVARRRSRTEWMHGLRQDIRYAARSLRRAPVLSLTVILTLALGIGANVAMFSLLDVVFLRPPAAVVRPGEIRRVWMQRRYSSGVQFGAAFNYMQYAALKATYAGQADVAIYARPQRRPIGREEDDHAAAASLASANYFSILGVKPSLGRFFAIDEDRLGSAAHVAVVSDAFWRRELGGNSSVLGQTVSIGGQSYVVIGVTPPRFSGIELDATDVWLPIVTQTGRPGTTVPWWNDPNINGFLIALRLLPGAREGEMEQRATAVLRRAGIGYGMDSVAVGEFGSIVAARGPARLSPEVQVATRLGGVATIVLIIACANVVNLLLARALSRRREIAVRLALGISSARLLRLLVTESLMLAAAAAAAAVVAAAWGGALLRGLLLPDVHFAESPLHWRVLAFALAVAVVAGLPAGLIAAMRSSAPDLTGSLKAGSRDGGGRRSALRGFLVVCQAALSMILLVGAALFIRSVHNVLTTDIGYAVDSLVFARVRAGAPDRQRDALASSRLLELEPTVARIAGVDRVAFTSMRPRYGMTWVTFFPDADTIAHRKPDGFWTAVTPDFFSVTGTRLLRGRTFSGPGAAATPTEVIVNQAMATGLWPGENAIGKCVRFDGPDKPCTTVIGVVQTAILNDFLDQSSPRFYFPIGAMSSRGWGAKDIVVRADPAHLPGVIRELRTVLTEAFPGATPDIITMAQAMEPEYRPWRLGATLFTTFGLLALLVAAIGIYSTISYDVTQRAHEFGVRGALGATAADVLRQVLGEGLRTAVIGVGAGALLALATGRLIASLLYGIKPSDPAVMMIVSLMLVAVATVAALGPARRAARADPMAALRSE